MNESLKFLSLESAMSQVDLRRSLLIAFQGHHQLHRGTDTLKIGSVLSCPVHLAPALQNAEWHFYWHRMKAWPSGLNMGLHVSSVEDSSSSSLHLLIRMTANFSQSQSIDAVGPEPRDLQLKKLLRKQQGKRKRPRLSVLSQRWGMEMEESPGNTNIDNTICSSGFSFFLF